MMKKFVLALLLIVTTFGVYADTGKVELPEGWQLELENSKPYIGESYVIELTYSGGNDVDGAFSVEYIPADGRELLRIEKKTIARYAADGRKTASDFTFFIYQKVISEDGNNPAVLKIYDRSEPDSEPFSVEISEPGTRRKILGAFTMSQFIVILIIILILLSGVLYLLKVRRQRKARRLEGEKRKYDKLRLELKALDRLVDRKNDELFVNQAHELYLETLKALRKQYESDSEGVDIIQEDELRRHAQRLEELLHDARFSGRELNKDEKEFIYNTCDDLFKQLDGV